jgi:hypothetical protein
MWFVVDLDCVTRTFVNERRVREGTLARSRRDSLRGLRTQIHDLPAHGPPSGVQVLVFSSNSDPREASMDQPAFRRQQQQQRQRQQQDQQRQRDQQRRLQQQRVSDQQRRQQQQLRDQQSRAQRQRGREQEQRARLAAGALTRRQRRAMAKRPAAAADTTRGTEPNLDVSAGGGRSVNGAGGDQENRSVESAPLAASPWPSPVLHSGTEGGLGALAPELPITPEMPLPVPTPVDEARARAITYAPVVAGPTHPGGPNDERPGQFRGTVLNVVQPVVNMNPWLFLDIRTDSGDTVAVRARFFWGALRAPYVAEGHYVRVKGRQTRHGYIKPRSIVNESTGSRWTKSRFFRVMLLLLVALLAALVAVQRHADTGSFVPSGSVVENQSHRHVLSTDE